MNNTKQTTDPSESPPTADEIARYTAGVVIGHAIHAAIVLVGPQHVAHVARYFGGLAAEDEAWADFTASSTPDE